MIEFSKPELILLLPFFIALTLMSHYFARKIKSSLEVFHYPPVRRLIRIVEKKGARRSSWRGISLVLKIGLIVLISISLAGPTYLGFTEVSKTTEISMVEEKDIVGGVLLVVDVSPSMGIVDVAPSRLNATRSLLVEYVANASDKVRFGVVAFEAVIKNSLSLTQNKTRVISLLESLHQVEALPCLEEFTDIGYGLRVSVNELSLFRPFNGTYVIVLVSDGFANYGYPDPFASVSDAIDDAVEANIPIYTVHVAKFGMDSNPELLKEIADKTNGKFMDATNIDELRSILDTLAKYHTPTNAWSTTVEISTTIPYRAELGHIPMFVAVIVILLLWAGNYKHYKTWF
jgi:Mg-chelatase subunit ChlD